MITVICGTNRPDAVSRNIAEQYMELLAEEGSQCKLIDLADLPPDFTSSALYSNTGKNEGFNELIKTMKESKKFVFVVAEYNGSFPGVLKAFIDGLPYPSPFANKKCGLVGLSSGVQGGGLALSHLTDILNYLGMHVLALKPKLARVESLMTEGRVTDKFHLELIEQQIKGLVRF